MVNTTAKSYLFIGPQGSGKGTQAKILADRLGYVFFSMGESLKKLRDSNTSLGKEARNYYDRGVLVPEHIVEQILIRFLRSAKTSKILFEGYPRTLYQKRIFLDIIKKFSIMPPIAIYLNINDKTAVERVAKRKLCSKCGRSFWPKDLKYHTNICSECGGKLQKRPDDTAELLTKRLKIFRERTKPLIESFIREKRLLSVDGAASIEDVSHDIWKKIKKIQYD